MHRQPAVPDRSLPDAGHPAPGRGLSRRQWLAAAAGVCLTPAVRAHTSRRQPWPAGHALPAALALRTAEGQPWSLAGLRGRPVLLNFWASWCEPCRAEMPALEQLAARHAAQGLQVVAVNYRESEAAVASFIARTGLQLPVVLDPSGSAARALDVHIFPTTIAIDRNGRGVFSVQGECDWASTPASDWVAALL